MVRTGPGGDTRVTPGPGGNLHVEARKMTMAALADFVNSYMELPVMDMTDLKGTFDLEFDISGEEVRAGARAHGVSVPPPTEPPAATDPAGVSLTASLQRLGLRLESRKAPAEVIVVDAAQKVPTEN